MILKKSYPIVDSFIQDFPQILSDKPFGLRIIEGEPNYPICFNELEESILQVDPKAEFRFGMSKYVITAPSLDNVVIKIPFSGTYDYYYDDDIDDVDYVDDNGMPYGFNFFQRKDYCKVEYEKYLELWYRNLDCFVAKTQLYTTINGINIFLQEKVVPYEDNWHSRKPSAHSAKTADSWIQEELLALDSNWLANCIDLYGESKTKRFIDYCNYQDPDIISDLHSGNIGYRTNNTPVILDFSGFAE